MANHYDIPSWSVDSNILLKCITNKLNKSEDGIRAGKPPVGLHLDVMKGDKLIQKLMLDEKKCYLFGRNTQMCDFCIDHQSCSRVHSAFVWHKHLNRAFLVDLGSRLPCESLIPLIFDKGRPPEMRDSQAHGTYIGSLRIEANKPTQLPVNSVFHFGASTRNYVMRERPQTGARPIIEELERAAEEAEGGLLGLPETETELDNLTEFNTAHNRRISMLGIGEDGESGGTGRTRKRLKRMVTFNEEEHVINPEDVDPSVGRFRNLIHTTVIPTKRQRLEGGLTSGLTQPSEDKPMHMKHLHPSVIMNQLYNDLPGEVHSGVNAPNTLLFSSAMASRLGLPLPNPAPEVEILAPASIPLPPQEIQQKEAVIESHNPEPETKKKKYAKEAWPGKKTLPPLLV